MFEFNAQELRSIILGKTTFRRCPLCDGAGTLYFTDASDFGCSKDKYEEAGGRAEILNSTEGCSYCRGLGMLQNIRL